MNTQLVHVSNNRLVTTSLLIAQNFGKKHKHVLESINNLECSQEFGETNFRLSSYISNQNKELPMYEITRDGFVFLCMGFTGAAAAQWKEKYIAAFNAMEQQLSQIQQAQPNPTDVLNSLNANMAQLASGMNMVLTQNQMVHKYIALLEMNQNTKRRVTPEDATLVKQLKAEGMSNKDVGRVLRISPTTVSLLNSDKYPFGKHDDNKPTIADVLDNMVRTEESKVRTMLGLLPNKELGE